MAWRVEISGGARKALQQIDRNQAARILRFLHERIEGCEDPRAVGQALKGSRFGELWRYRVGDYRLITRIDDGVLTVLVLRIGHRREIYR